VGQLLRFAPTLKCTQVDAIEGAVHETTHFDRFFESAYYFLQDVVSSNEGARQRRQVDWLPVVEPHESIG
jgi:aminopeptidase C